MVDSTERGIQVIDAAVPPEMAARLADALKKIPYAYGWKSVRDRDWPGHWNAKILPGDHANVEDQAPMLATFRDPWEIFRIYWGLVAAHFSEPALLRYYSNSYTYGTDGYPHTDSERAGEYTALLYLCPSWKREWAGATAIWNQDGTDIERVVLPEPSRLLIFPGTRLHAAWAVSRICHAARTVLVVKVRDDAR